jgi:hypothetical protein
MSKQKTVTKIKTKTKAKTTLKFCHCGHQVILHDMQYGCTAIVEGAECEDHWVCGCKDVVCIHLAAYQRMKKAKQW